MNIFQGKIIAIVALIIVSYAAYSHYLNVSKLTNIPFLDRVVTTNEFIENSALQEKVVNFCQNDLGQLDKDPNCVNAKLAMLMAVGGSGKGNFPSINSTPKK